MTRQLTVDFNEELDDGLLLADDRDAVPGTRIAVGAQLVVGDDDAGVCMAEVVEHDPVSGVLTLRLLDDQLRNQRAEPAAHTR